MAGRVGRAARMAARSSLAPEDRFMPVIKSRTTVSTEFHASIYRPMSATVAGFLVIGSGVIGVGWSGLALAHRPSASHQVESALAVIGLAGFLQCLRRRRQVGVR